MTRVCQLTEPVRTITIEVVYAMLPGAEAIQKGQNQSGRSECLRTFASETGFQGRFKDHGVRNHVV